MTTQPANATPAEPNPWALHHTFDGQPILISDQQRRRCVRTLLITAQAGLATALAGFWLPLITVVSFTVLVGSCGVKSARPTSHSAVSGIDVLRDRPPQGADSNAVFIVHDARPYAIAILALVALGVIASLVPFGTVRRRAIAIGGAAGAALLTLGLLSLIVNHHPGIYTHIGPAVTSGLGVALVAAALLRWYPATPLRVDQRAPLVIIIFTCLFQAPFVLVAAAYAYSSGTSPPDIGGQVFVIFIGTGIAWWIAGAWLSRRTKRLRPHVDDGRCWRAAGVAVGAAAITEIVAFGALANVGGIGIGLVLAIAVACTLAWWVLSGGLPTSTDDLRWDCELAADQSTEASESD
jgi:hypothetical protein